MTAHRATTAADLTVYSAAEAPDGSGIEVTAKPEAVAQLRAAAAVAGAIPITVTAGTPIRAFTWRWNDTFPLIGGDVLISVDHGGGLNLCSAGLAAEGSGGRDYLVTADHCFAQGAAVFGDGSPVGYFPADPNNLIYGRAFGKIANTNSPYFDTELVDTGRFDGAGTNSDEADSPDGKWYPVPTDHYSYGGDTVCQDGARSYYATGHHIPCGITVGPYYFGNLIWDDNTVHAFQGIEGSISNKYLAGMPGDSGGMVFAEPSAGQTTRDARGQVTGGWSDSTYNYLIWAEAPDILGSVRLGLNPHQ
jgi:hypothetical protein